MPRSSLIPLLALLSAGCAMWKGPGKHNPQFGWAGRDVSHPRVVAPDRLTHDGLELVITKAVVREAGTIVHKDGTTLMMEGELINHRGRNLVATEDFFMLFWVVGPSGQRYHAGPNFGGEPGGNGWLPVMENTGVPYYLVPGNRGRLSFQVSFAGEDGDGDPIQLDFGGARAEIR